MRYGGNGGGLGQAVRNRKIPSVLVLSRQNLPYFERTQDQIAGIAKGAYVLKDAADARAVLIATGSEVQLAMQAAEALAQKNIAVRVVSMPSTDVFDKQDAAYRDSVLPSGLPRVAIEAAASDYWRKYVGLDGDVVGMTSFGESAPAGKLFSHFGFTVDNVVSRVEAVLGK